MLFVTRKGIVKKTVLSEFQNVTKNGIKAINIDDDDELVSAELVERGDEVIVASAFGQAVHFTEDQLRPLGRASRGVRGIRLAGVTFADPEEAEGEDEEGGASRPGEPSGADRVVAVVKVEKDPAARILLMVENGYGTLNTFDSYPIHKRGGKGVRSIDTGDRNGKVVFAAAVHLERPDSDPAVETGEKATLPADQILVVTAKGQLIRTSVGSIRETARGAKGVRIVNVAAGDAVVSATVVPDSGEDGASPSGLPDSPDSAEPAPPSPAERE